MVRLYMSKRRLFALATVVLIGLNFYTFSVAYLTMTHPLNLGGTDVPRDFSVYYIAAWRMLHNPSQIFTNGSLNDGEPEIYPAVTPYKYLPSFLLLISPLTNLVIIRLFGSSRLSSSHCYLSLVFYFSGCSKIKTQLLLF